LAGIQPSQADYFPGDKGGGHGDYRLIVLAPASVQEMVDLTFKGFDLADKYRMPVMLLADGTIGQMMEPVTLNAAKSLLTTRARGRSRAPKMREKEIS
jgi:2-oxoglutarate ferredoxin oxidoreductase subunit alpha